MIKILSTTIGIILFTLGLIGFISNSIVGLFDVSTVQNILHIISGIIAFVAVRKGESSARLYLIFFGIFYALIAIIGFANNGYVLGLFTTNHATDYVYTIIALTSLAVGFKEA